MSFDETTLFEAADRSTTRRRLVGGAAALLALAATARTRAQESTPEAVSSPEASEPSAATPVPPLDLTLPYLFIQTSAQGSWSAVRGQPGTFWLTLSDPSPQTIVIRDEPIDAAGTISTALFFDSIQFSAQNPLQAVISAQTATGEDVLIVSLLRANYDPTIGELTYLASKLDEYTDQHGLTPLRGQEANFTLPPAFGATSVFITNAVCRDSDENACNFG